MARHFPQSLPKKIRDPTVFPQRKEELIMVKPKKISPRISSAIFSLALFVAISLGGGLGFDRAHAGFDQWTQIGPEGGYISVLAIDPITPSTLYVGLGNGIYKSINWGGTWTPANTGLTNFNISAIAIDPLDSDTLYAGTSNGLFKSTNGGENWISANNGLTGTVIALAIDPQNPAVVYAGIDFGGVFKSVNGGGNWSPANNGLPTMPYSSDYQSIRALAVNPSAPNILYAGAYGGDGGLFQSTDFGANWNQLTNGLPFSGFDAWVNALAIYPLSPNTIYVLTNDGPYKSTDGGATWNAANTGLADAFGFFALALNPLNADILYVGTDLGVFKSTDGGTSWNPANNGNSGLNTRWVNTLVIDPLNPTTLYAGTDGLGVFKSTDGAANWNLANHGLFDMDINVLAIDPVNPNTLYAGSWFAGIFKSTDSGTSWANVLNDRPAWITTLAIDPGNSNTIYAGTEFCNALKSTDGGANWNDISNGLYPCEAVNALAIDPSNPNTLYLGASPGYGGYQDRLNDLLKSTDGGASWTLMNNGLPYDSHPTYGYDYYTTVNALAIDPLNPNTIYAGTVNGIYKSTNGAGSWSPAQNGLPGYGIFSIVIDPKNPNTLYAGGVGGVYKTTNGGGSWKTINKGFADPSPWVNVLAIDPLNPSTLYAGANGVYKTTDSGTNWYPLNNGLTNKDVKAIAIDPLTTSTLYAGTYRDSAFKIQQVTVFAVNCGGPKYTDKSGIVYQADNAFTGGMTYTTAAAIAGTEDDPLYQTERFGNFSYNIPLPNGVYSATLKFAEIYAYLSHPDQRVFSVFMEGKEVVKNLDLFAKAGKYNAYDVTIPVVVSDGILNIEFRTALNAAKVNAIVIAQTGSLPTFTITATAGPNGTINPQGTITVDYGSTKTFYINADPGYRIADVKVDGDSKGSTNTLTIANIKENHTVEASFEPLPAQPVFAVNCGGPQYTAKNGFIYKADTGFSTGQTYTTTAAIAGTEDDFLYQTERYGNFAYNFPLANGNYNVTLQFAEIYPYISGPGSRVFNVKVEGKEVISNLDLFAKVGKNKAYDVTIPVTVTDGVLNIQFQTIVNAAKVNAILVEVR